MNFLPFLQASTESSVFFPIITFGLIFVVFYFFIIRPQNKKQKETEKMISALKKGDKIITIGGIHGEVTSTKEKTVVVKVDDNCKIEFSRSAVSSIMTDPKAEKPAKLEKAEKTDKADKDEKKDKEK
ncbi:preprotein translocase subunit YajC [Brucepastera parasyntrophica]|uniref:preprotein translocase subunit YajC n=1 Tax=Brucepastera parasyntrophica TaxID=2880008 RepID=UPI0034E20900